jgi:hypothetical protein
MSLREEGVKHREGAITQALMGIKQNLETLEVIGFRLLDHPIAGLATDLEKFHALIVKAEKAHAEHMSKKMALVLAPAKPPAEPATESEIEPYDGEGAN